MILFYIELFRRALSLHKKLYYRERKNIRWIFIINVEEEKSIKQKKMFDREKSVYSNH